MIPIEVRSMSFSFLLEERILKASLRFETFIITRFGPFLLLIKCQSSTEIKHKAPYFMLTTPNINKELRNKITSLISILPSFREHKLCENDELLLPSLPTKNQWNGKSHFSPNLVNWISKLNTFIINSKARKSIRNSKRNCKQHHEQNQSRKARILSAKSGQHKIKTDLSAM